MDSWVTWALAVAAVWAIWALYRRLRRARLEAPVRLAAKIAEELVRRGDVKEMARGYGKGELAGRLGAVLALATINSEAAVAPLIAAMDDEHLEIRLIAARGLGKLPGERAFRALIEKGLSDPSTLMRTSVMRFLGERGDPEAAPAIAKAMRAALSDPVLNSRELQAGAHALALLGDRRGLWVLKDAQQCELKRVREAALQAQAILDLRAKLDRDGQDSAAARDLGAHYIAAGEPQRAREVLLRAVRLNPKDASARKALGVAYEQLGDGERAAAEYREAARLVPDDPVAHAALGDALARLGRTHEAREAYERFLELQPSGPEARRIRAAVRRLS